MQSLEPRTRLSGTIFTFPRTFPEGEVDDPKVFVGYTRIRSSY